MLQKEVNVREIYSLSYKAYQEYEQKRDMRLFNERIQEISRRHPCNFCENLLISLAGQVQGEHDEWRQEHA